MVMMKKTIQAGVLSLVGGILMNIQTTEVQAEITTTTKERSALAVTIYNDNLALIKDTRQINLDAGQNQVAFRDVSAQIRPETASIKTKNHPNVHLLEQNFDFDLLTPDKLLEKHVGKTITVIRTNPATGQEFRENATVLSTNNGIVLKYANRIEIGNPGRYSFNHIPANLRDRPTLVLNLATPNAITKTPLELSYLTGGLGWKADYVANLSTDQKTMTLNGWITLTNTSGTSYENALLQLVAGSVNRVQPKHRAMAYPAVAMAAPAPTMAAPNVAEESLFDYHLYTLDRLTSIAENQTKQVALLSAQNIPMKHLYILNGNDYYYYSQYGEISKKLKPNVFLEFENKNGDLGKPLPAGIMRVYTADKAGRTQFIGEDSVEHTPKNEKIRLKMGEAFDISVDKVQTTYRQIKEKQAESSYRFTLRNAKDTPVTVRVVEPLGTNWEILNESQKNIRENSQAVRWDVTIPAEGEKILEYKVRNRIH